MTRVTEGTKQHRFWRQAQGKQDDVVQRLRFEQDTFLFTKGNELRFDQDNSELGTLW